MRKLESLFSGRAGLILTALLLVALSASVAVNLWGREPVFAQGRNAATAQQRAALYDLENAFTSLVEEVLPSVVSITSVRAVTTSGGIVPWFDDEFFKNFPFPLPQPRTPEPPRSEERQSYGSGVIVRSDGYILTNDHVVGGADKVKVTLKDGREFEGNVLRDPRSDLALVKIDAKDLPAAKLGDSSKVRVGSWAIAIGSPFGLDQTVTVGVISAVGRQAAAPEGAGFYPNLIQTDASINPGNSGGPLVNIDGEVIGINTLIRSSLGGGNIGIGFAIPVNTAKFVMDQLITHGKVTRGYLGVRPTDLTPKMAERYGVEKGAFVQSVEMGTPADKAGVQVEDVIVEFNGKPISSEIELRETVAATPPGTQAKVVVIRDKERKTLTVEVGEAPALEASESPAEEVKSKLGFEVQRITPELREQYGLEGTAQGVIVTKVTPGSSASRAGIEPGMVVVRANDQPIRSVADFNAATKDLKSNDTVRLVLQTKARRLLVEFTLD